MKEKWKKYNTNIEISNYGNIKINGILKKPYKDKNGYLIIYSNKKNYKVHRLVALTFIDNPFGKEEVNHKDMDKTNNKVENLEWATHLENMQHAFKNRKIKRYKKKVYQYKLNGELVKIWSGVRYATKKMNYSHGNISKCCNHKIKTYKNFIWRFEGDELL